MANGSLRENVVEYIDWFKWSKTIKGKIDVILNVRMLYLKNKYVSLLKLLILKTYVAKKSNYFGISWKFKRGGGYNGRTFTPNYSIKFKLWQTKAIYLPILIQTKHMLLRLMPVNTRWGMIFNNRNPLSIIFHIICTMSRSIAP